MSLFNEYGNLPRESETMKTLDKIYDLADGLFRELRRQKVSVLEMRAIESLAHSQISGAAACNILHQQMTDRRAKEDGRKQLLEAMKQDHVPSLDPLWKDKSHE